MVTIQSHQIEMKRVMLEVNQKLIDQLKQKLVKENGWKGPRRATLDVGRKGLQPESL
jgi:hypothetical protein